MVRVTHSCACVPHEAVCNYFRGQNLKLGCCVSVYFLPWRLMDSFYVMRGPYFVTTGAYPRDRRDKAFHE